MYVIRILKSVLHSTYSKRTIKNLNKLIKSDQDNLKNVIENLIIEKVDLLNPKTPEINPLYVF